MKQLKFMLAAATAISLATAAQADTQLVKTEISSENFDAVTTLEDTAALMALDGFTYEGATATDNESYVVAGGANSSANALKVNTGTDPLLRKIDTDSNNAVALDATKKVYIDTMVQFTVTPNGDTVTKSDDDKLMIYLKEDLSDADAPKTNLVVKAGYKGAGTLEAKDYVLDIDGKKVLPGVWYSLKVVAYGNVAVAADGMDVYPAFEIYIDNTLARIANAGSCTDLQVPENVPIFLLGSFSERLSAGTLFLSMQVNSSTLDKVGFAGEGMVDELVFSHDVEQETSVDFTFTWTTEGISAVKYAIGDATEYTALGDDKTIADLEETDVIKIKIETADWYAVKEGADLEYTASEGSANLDNLVAAVTTKVDPDTGDVVVKPDASASDVGINSNSAFADADAEKLGEVLTWAKNASVTVDQINKMTFSTAGDPAGTTAEAKALEEAYLLNCSPAEVENQKKAFKLSADDLAKLLAEGTLTELDVDNNLYNGKVVIEGRNDLGTGTWEITEQGNSHKFYRARLIFK